MMSVKSEDLCGSWEGAGQELSESRVREDPRGQVRDSHWKEVKEEGDGQVARAAFVNSQK